LNWPKTLPTFASSYKLLKMNDVQFSGAPAVAGLKNRLVRLLMRLSFLARHNPTRFLFSERILKIKSMQVDQELQFFQKNWGGPVWDVGASVGKYTTILARANPEHTVYAFEPNLNSLYYLGYRSAKLKNVVLVPTALTLDGSNFETTYDPNFFAPPTGPMACSLSLAEAIRKFGKPSFAKFDVEGGEYILFDSEMDVLRGCHLLIEWHKYKFQREIPNMKHWRSRDVVPDDGIQVTRYYEPID
jgi:FkbM family methyltransferase